jgi:hypothetical protein
VDLILADEIERRPRRGDECALLAFETANDRGPHHAAMPGNENSLSS